MAIMSKKSKAGAGRRQPSEKKASPDPTKISGNLSTHFSGTRVSFRVINLTF